MAAITKNLYIEQGVNYSVIVNVTGSSLPWSGATASSQIKSVTGTLIESFSVSINQTAGIITLSLTGATSAAAPSGAYKWDILFKLNGTFYRLVQGDCFISPAQSTLS
jgi:hypothetical protein